MLGYSLPEFPKGTAANQPVMHFCFVIKEEWKGELEISLQKSVKLFYELKGKAIPESVISPSYYN